MGWPGNSVWAALAEAAPLTIRVDGVVTPGHMVPLIEALGSREPAVFKHFGHSYVVHALRFNGTTPQIQVQAIRDLEVASLSTSARSPSPSHCGA